MRNVPPAMDYTPVLVPAAKPVAGTKPLFPELSVVIPVYNEADSIQPLYDELTRTLERMSRTYEVVVVDDGSTDLSFARLRILHEQDKRWRIIRLRRNFGQTAGLMAGFEAARGSYIITMDANLQNDPNDIPLLLERMREGYDVVSGWRKFRKESRLSRLSSRIVGGLVSKMTGVSLHDYGCTLRVYRREVAKDLRLYGELHRFSPIIASGMGVALAEVPVNDRARRFGKSNVDITRAFRLMIDLISVVFFLNYSTRPLHLFGLLGFITGSVGGLIGLYLAYARLFLGQAIGDRPLFLLAMLLIILAVQFIGTGLVAEFITRSAREPQARKIFAVRERLEDAELTV